MKSLSPTASSALRARGSCSDFGTPWNTMPSLTFSMIVHQGNSAFSWNTKAMSCGSGPRTGLPCDLDRAGGRRQQAADHVEQRALAAAARPDQAEQLAARDVERGVLQRLHELRVARLAELVRDVPDADRGVGRCHRPILSSRRDVATGPFGRKSTTSWPGLSRPSTPRLASEESRGCPAQGRA